jgi:SPP1 gp7 family putative phage head morphogenesis protein
VLEGLIRKALTRRVEGGSLVAPHRLLDDGERAELADALASVLAFADLFGRARVRELAERAKAGPETFSDAEPTTFAADPPGIIAAPEAALEYFRSLVPSLGIDPGRWGDSLRRKAFTLAASTDETITGRVQQAIADAIAEGKSHRQAAADIDGLLDAAGVSASNPSYSAAVWRTNAADAYQTAAYEEMTHPDVADAFPAFEYLAITDSRARPTHAAKNGRIYPASASFAEVRGTDAGDVVNCRCSFRPLTAGQLARLEAEGRRVESEW